MIGKAGEPFTFDSLADLILRERPVIYRGVNLLGIVMQILYPYEQLREVPIGLGRGTTTEPIMAAGDLAVVILNPVYAGDYSVAANSSSLIAGAYVGPRPSADSLLFAWDALCMAKAMAIHGKSTGDIGSWERSSSVPSALDGNCTFGPLMQPGGVLREHASEGPPLLGHGPQSPRLGVAVAGPSPTACIGIAEMLVGAMLDAVERAGSPL